MTQDLWDALNRRIVDHMQSITLGKLTDDQRAKRKAKAAATIAELPVVQTAIWYSANVRSLTSLSPCRMLSV